MLRFSFGLMKCGKSLNLIALYYSLKNNKKNSIGVFVPEICGDSIESRAPMKLEVTSQISTNSRLNELCAPYSFILVDEVQFCSPKHIEELRILADNGAFVYCFGLLTNWQLELFPASKRLIELADSVLKCEHVPNVCSRCGHRIAIGHLKESSVNNEIIQIDKQIYSWSCFSCHDVEKISNIYDNPAYKSE